MAATSMYKRMLIGLACCAVVVIAICGFFYCNRAGKLHTLQLDRTQKQAQMDSSEKIAARLPVARREYLDAQAKLSVLEQGVSSKVYVPTFLRQIEELGRKNRLQVVGVRPKAAEVNPPVVSRANDTAKDGKADAEKAEVKPPPEPYDKLMLDIELKGKYWDVVTFMREITSFPKIVAVNDIQISPMGKTSLSASPPLSVRFNATAFILKQQPGAKVKESAKVVAEAQDGDKG